MKAVLRKLVLLGVSVAVVVVAAVIYNHFAGSNGTANSRDEKLSFKSPNNFGPITRIGQGERSLDHGEKIDSYSLYGLCIGISTYTDFGRFAIGSKIDNLGKEFGKNAEIPITTSIGLKITLPRNINVFIESK